MSIFTVSLATVCMLLQLTSANADVITVPQLNISRYVGRWYQMYGSYEAEVRSQRGCNCVTADYELLPNKSISVLNSCRLTTPNGTVRDIKGLAFRPDDSEQGKLKVALNGVPFPPRDYWVIQLGPPTFEGDFYQYAVVSNKCKIDLFVVARNATEFRQSYEEGVLAYLKKQGFTRFHNKPRVVYQESDCVYV